MAATRRKVLFILPTLRGGGAERVVLDLLRFLDRSFFDPTLLLFKREGAYWTEVPSDLRVEALVDAGERLRRHPLRALTRVLRCAAGADVVVGALELRPTYVAYAAGRLVGRPAVGWVHTSLPQYLQLAASSSDRWLRWVYPRLAALVCPSRGVAESLGHVALVPAARVRIIPNLVDVARVARMASAPAPSWAATPFAGATVVGIGSLVPWKGFDILIRAHAHLRAARCDHQLIILGEGPQRGALEALARDLGVQDSVHLPGFVSNPYPLLARATVFALPSRLEGFAVVLLEAMALGVPVVAADCVAGPAEVLARGACGHLVRPDDPEALADGLSRLLGDRGYRERLAAAGRQRVQEYLPERIVPRWERILVEVCQ